MLFSMQIHPNAYHVSVLVFILLGHVHCDEKDAKWYTSLRTALQNCPKQSWNDSGEDDFLEKFRRCVQDRASAVLDSLLGNDVIAVVDGLDLVRFQDEDRVNRTDNGRVDSEPDDDANWIAIIVKRLRRVLRTHVFKVDVDRLANDVFSQLNNSKTEVENNIFEGRRRHRHRHNHMMPLMMMGFVLMGSILIPMGFQFLAVLGGKALILAKMALILSSIQGLKKIATNGVNYGLYHAPVDHAWQRSHIEQNQNMEPLPFPPHFRP
ncbi:PREDICTED: uncharacterized protein LOC107186949 [Dufourea novaeangliae]|uniref:Uncharacterized protein n=1 Tax=Dufourea novaeangliae TaxID=178035 RepID=A0A154PAI4_DUFNO|nr:PREDICTED: uncharacterized protein LOC107186949 [Dufourea novaeangliae]KZC08827.1 hypothetical protein WN55_11330 [Dufourea novaeangliae]